MRTVLHLAIMPTFPPIPLPNVQLVSLHFANQNGYANKRNKKRARTETTREKYRETQRAQHTNDNETQFKLSRQYRRKEKK